MIGDARPVEPSLATDDAFLAVRAEAMPPKATGAVLRVTARLDFDARVAIAARLGVDDVPADVSVWGDVADDLALVADLDAPDEGPGSGVGNLVTAWRDALTARPEVAALGLEETAEAIRIVPRGDAVRVIALIGPRRLERAVSRAKLFLEPSP